MEQSTVSNETLYARVLGRSWLSLHESVRVAHRGQLATHYEGFFQIRHGESRRGRLLARIMRMPAAGERVRTRLVVSAEGSRERWRRSFDRVELVTVQQAGTDGTLLERAGPLELRFRLIVEHGALYYQQTGAALVLGSFRCSLPAWLAPTVSAREAPTEDPDLTTTVVKILAPGKILLLRYEGRIKPVGGAW